METCTKQNSLGGDSDMECSDTECYDDYDYYNNDDNDIDEIDPRQQEVEYFNCETLNEEQVERLLNEVVELLSNNLQITPFLAKVLLYGNQWDVPEIVKKYKDNASSLLVKTNIKPAAVPQPLTYARYITCSVCVTVQNMDKFHSLSCSHMFCKECWMCHFEVQINQVGFK